MSGSARRPYACRPPVLRANGDDDDDRPTSAATEARRIGKRARTEWLTTPMTPPFNDEQSRSTRKLAAGRGPGHQELTKTTHRRFTDGAPRVNYAGSTFRGSHVRVGPGKAVDAAADLSGNLRGQAYPRDWRGD